MSNDEASGRVRRARFTQFIWWLVRVDPEILSGCPTIDRFQMISKAVLLAAVAGVAVFAWGGFFGQFWPVYISVPLTLVVIVWIVTIDQIMGASRWALQGVLAAPTARGLGLSAALIFRLVIGGVTASATSYSATMLMCFATIDAQLQRDRDDANAAKRAAGAAEKAQLRQTMLGARDAEVKQALAEIDALNGKLEAAQQLRDGASQQVTDTKVQADCQLTGGPGCRRGAGPQFREALIRQEKATADGRRAESDIASLQAALPAATRKLDDAQTAFRAREPEFLEAAKAIDKRVSDEAVPARNDPVMSYMALQRVFASPAGAAARFYAHLMLGLLLMVELSYVLVSEYFGHASVYMARLIARTKILAADAADEYRRKIGALFEPDGERTGAKFRVVPRFGQDDADG